MAVTGAQPPLGFSLNSVCQREDFLLALINRGVHKLLSLEWQSPGRSPPLGSPKPLFADQVTLL